MLNCTWMVKHWPRSCIKIVMNEHKQCAACWASWCPVIHKGVSLSTCLLLLCCVVLEFPLTPSFDGVDFGAFGLLLCTWVWMVQRSTVVLIARHYLSCCLAAAHCLTALFPRPSHPCSLPRLLFFTLPDSSSRLRVSSFRQPPVFPLCLREPENNVFFLRPFILN